MKRSNGFLKPLLALSAATFTTVSAEMMPTGVLDALSSSFSVSTAAAGLLVSVWAGTIALTSIPLVRATRRWGRKPLILATLTILAAANAVTAVAPTYAIALASRVVGAAAHGLFWAVVVAYAASLVPPERVGRALSIVLAGPTLASLVALPLGSAVAHRIGWQVTFVGLAVACLLCVILLSIAAPGGEADVSADGGGRWDGTAVPVLWVAVGGLFALVGFYALFTFVIPVSSAVAGIGAAAMPGVLLASGIGGLLGVLVAGNISDRWPTRALPVTAVVLAIVLAGAGAARSPIPYVAVAVAWGVLIGILPVVLQANVMRVASESFRPIAGSILVTFLNLGVALGALLGSTISTRGTLSTLPFIAATTATLAVVPLLLSSRWSRRQQPEPRPTDEPGAAEADMIATR